MEQTSLPDIGVLQNRLSEHPEDAEYVKDCAIKLGHYGLLQAASNYAKVSLGDRYNCLKISIRDRGKCIDPVETFMWRGELLGPSTAKAYTELFIDERNKEFFNSHLPEGMVKLAENVICDHISHSENMTDAKAGIDRAYDKIYFTALMNDHFDVIGGENAHSWWKYTTSQVMQRLKSWRD